MLVCQAFTQTASPRQVSFEMSTESLQAVQFTMSMDAGQHLMMDADSAPAAIPQATLDCRAPAALTARCPRRAQAFGMHRSAGVDAKKTVEDTEDLQELKCCWNTT